MSIWLNVSLLLVTFTTAVWALELYRRVKRLKRCDDLTGALSRVGFIEVLEHETTRARRHLHPLTIAYVDVDDFKLVNDVLGHETGNSVLQLVAFTMQETLREIDFVARLGGDEFTLLLSETKAEDVGGVLKKVQTALLGAMKAKGWRVTFSIGAVTFTVPLATAKEMLAKADELMHSAKLSGKDCIEHSIVDESNTNHLVRCAKCRTSFAVTSHACPICGGTALLDLHAADHAHTQRGVQAYITNLEGELTATLRTLEAILDVLTGAGTHQDSRRDGGLYLTKEDMQKIAAAAGAPEGLANSEGAVAPLLIFKQRISELRTFAVSRRRVLNTR